nr:DUF1565 domain-containing protein [Bacteroidota bacterium]
GGGIESNFSTVLLQNLTIKGNSTFWSFDGGGGIYCNNSLLELQNITIKENISDKGGGIFVAASNPVIQNCTIDSNYATYGGGIYCSEGAIPVLKNTTIKNNTASEMGGGLYNDQSAPGFDETNRSNIYLNNALYGNDLYSDTTIHVVVDTFTVLNPTEFHAEPFQNFTFDILYGKVDQVDADLYVSPTGDNSNSGLTPDEPLKTIRYALSAILPDSISQNTVRLLDGTYSTSENGELFPINVPDNVNLQGISQNDVILDAEGQSGVMIIDNNTTNYIAGLTITGGITMYGSGISISNSSPTIQDVSIINNINDDYWSYGGGIYCSYSNPSLQNVNISNNSANTGGGIYCSFSNPQLQDVNISNNSTYSYGGAGGGIFCYNSDPLLQGVIISENSSKNGGGIYCDESNPVIENTDIINNTANGYQDTGGGGICCINSNPVLQGVNILNNTAYAFAIKGGGGICCINSNPTLSEVIISGNLSTNGGGIYLENSSPEMQNVTISNNSTDANNTEDIGGGGICCKSSSPLLQNVQITSNFSDRDGGGMVCSLNSSPTFIDVTITDNSTNEYAERKGGGIYCVNSSTDFENVLIQGNYAPMGGGFYFSSTSTQEFELVTIKNNSATKGGGIYCSSSDIEFHHTNRSNIYFNNAVQGNDLFSDVLMEVVVDTFSVLYPTSYYAQPLENFTFDILNGKIELLDADLYVSPDGDNENSGLTAGDPLKNIWAAQAKILTDSLHPHTIHLLEGIYSSTENEEIFPINMMNFLSLSGESENNVILDAEGQAGVMLIENISNSSIEGITITGGNSNMGGGIYCNNSNPVFQNLIISNNIATGYGGKNGGGIYCKDSNPIFNNVFILENEAEYGGGIWCDHSSPVLNNVTISYNSASDIAGSGDCYGGGIACVNGSNPIFIGALISNNTTTGGWDGEGYGGGIYCDNSNPIIKNAFLLGNYAYDYGGGMHCHLNCSPLLINTQFTGNEAGDSGGGISCLYDCFPTLVNVTISDNSSDEVGGAIYAYVTSSPSIVNSILWNNSPHEIFGNSINITYSDVKDGWEGEGNIDADPLFTETGDHPFSLTDESPCVNTGTPDTTGLYLPDLDLAGNPRFYGGRIDMGAYENQNVMVCLESLESGVWSSEFEVRCYPNPFYNQTTIHFNQPNAGFANLSIHDITGKKILTLHSGFLQAGEHGFVWDAEGMPEGMYLLRLEKAGVTESRKLLLLK